MYRLLRPILFQLPAETAHEYAIAATIAIDRVPFAARFVRWLAHPIDDPIEIAGLSFANRVGLAGGMDKNALAPLAWWAFGFGFVELGTVTPRPQPGNPKPRMFRYVADRAIVNRMGFNNDGAAAVASRLEQQRKAGRRPSIPLGVSIGKNKDTPIEEAAMDYESAAKVVAPQADFLSINISSPNTPGLRGLQTPETLAELVRTVIRAGGGKPVFVKLAPELLGVELKSVVDAGLDAGASGIIATNTLATGASDGREQGGLSGRPLQELSRSRVSEVKAIVGNRAAVIGCGGIDDGRSAQAMIDAGADLIQLYTGLVYEGPFLPARISRHLARR